MHQNKKNFRKKKILNLALLKNFTKVSLMSKNYYQIMENYLRHQLEEKPYKKLLMKIMK